MPGSAVGRIPTIARAYPGKGEKMQNIKIKYELTEAAALAEAMAGRESHRAREHATTWEELVRELIRPGDLCGSGEREIEIKLPDQNEVLSREAAVNAARMFRAGEITEVRRILAGVLAKMPGDFVTELRAPRKSAFLGEEIYKQLAAAPENLAAYLRPAKDEPDAWNHDKIAGHRLGLLLPAERADLETFHAAVKLEATNLQAHLDAVVNTTRAVDERTRREAAERAKILDSEDMRAYTAACGRWLASIDPVVGLAVVEGTISPAGVAARLREKLTLAVQAGTPSVGEFMTEDPGDDSDEHALPNKWAPAAAEIVRDVRTFLEPSGELDGWSTLRWTEDGNVVAWTLELSTLFNVPGYPGERKFPLELRAGFEQ